MGVNSPALLDLQLFPNLLCWQVMFSPYLESFTPAFCAEVPEAESVN
jgi:hypothetical protein